MNKLKLNVQKFASGIISLGTNGNLEGQIIWNSSSNGTAANSSNVSATLQIRRTNTATTTGTFSYGFQVGSTSQNSSWYGSISSNWVTIAVLNTTITHNNNGDGTAYIGAWVTGPSGTSLAGITVSGNRTVTLDHIDRYATITGADNFNDEQDPNITFNNPAGFDLLLRITVGSETLVTRDKVTKTSPYQFVLTDAERNLLRQKTINNNSLIVRFNIGTYINNQIQNTSYIDRTMTIVNANPTFSNFDFDDINSKTLALTGNSKININGYSTIRAKISNTNKAIAKKFATMSKYRFIIDNQSKDIDYSDTGEVYADIPNSKIGTYSMYAIDSRNNSTLVTKLATSNIEYEPIYINKNDCNVSRDNNEAGNNCILTFKGTIWDKSFGAKTNSVRSASYRFKKTTSDIWINGTTDITPKIENGEFSFSALVRSDSDDYTFDFQSSYDFEITISDELSSYTVKLTPLSRARPHIAMADNGLGLMGPYDEEKGGLVQIGGRPIDELMDIGVYSITENKIGTLNGKPLYRCVFTGNLEVLEYKHNLDIESLVDIRGTAVKNSIDTNAVFPITCVRPTNSTYEIAIYVRNTTFHFEVGSSITSDYNFILILEYTKNDD